MSTSCTLLELPPLGSQGESDSHLHTLVVFYFFILFINQPQNMRRWYALKSVNASRNMVRSIMF